MAKIPKHGLDVLVNVTNICNARCVFCNIWKNQEGPTSWLPVELLKSVKPISTVSLAGGEPFLHEGIVDLVQVIHDNNPDAKIIFSSNGFRTDEIVAKMEKILAIHPFTQVTISLDGPGKMHDRVRGIPGAWDKVNRTFDELGRIGVPYRNFCFTITEENYPHLPEVYAHAKKKGAGLSIGVAQSSKFLNVEIPHLSQELVYPVLNPIIEENLKTWRPFNWARAFFLYGILRYLDTGKRPILCDALSQQITIDQTGDVFSCHPILLKAGNLSEQPLPEILGSEKTAKLKEEIRDCHACWETCTARSGIRNNLFRFGLWAVMNKAGVHLGFREGKKGTRLFPLTLKA